MSDLLVNDRDFMIECIKYSPLIFFDCLAPHHQTNVRLFVLALKTSYSKGMLERFLNELGEDKRKNYSRLIDIYIEESDFCTFLACCWKSRQQLENYHSHPLSRLECGIETSVGLKKHIRSYVGIRTSKNRQEIRGTLYRLLRKSALYQEYSLPLLIQCIPHEIVIKFILSCLHYKSQCHLIVPVELWSDRDFVLQWLQWGGTPNNLIQLDLASDLDILRAAYPKLFDITNPFHPKRLLQCALKHPFIFNSCYGKAARYDIDFLIHYCILLCAGERKQETGKRKHKCATFDQFVEAAVRGGWAHVLLDLDTTVKAKVADQVAYQSFIQLLEETSGETRLAAAIGSKAKRNICSFLCSNHRKGFRALLLVCKYSDVSCKIIYEKRPSLFRIQEVLS